MPTLKYWDATLGEYVPISGGGGSGASDHGDLTGLENDDHVQYHTDARADARYPSIAYVNEIVTVSTDAPSAAPARDGLLWVQV